MSHQKGQNSVAMDFCRFFVARKRDPTSRAVNGNNNPNDNDDVEDEETQSGAWVGNADGQRTYDVLLFVRK